MGKKDITEIMAELSLSQLEAARAGNKLVAWCIILTILNLAMFLAMVFVFNNAI